MIQKLRFKFVMVAMSGIGCLLLLILLSVNLFMTFSSRSQGFAMLEDIAFKAATADALQRGTVPPTNEIGNNPLSSQSPAASDALQRPARRPPAYQDAFRFFSISYDENGLVSDTNYNPDSDLSESDILALGKKVLHDRHPAAVPRKGTVQSRYLYLLAQKESGYRLYFLDYSVEHTMTYRLFWLCLFVGLGGMLVLFAVVWWLSGWMVRPVQDAFEKQKQFIADASHELKTPLTILSANADVLAASLTDNRWLGHIQEQVIRMNTLIRELLDLARLDSGSHPPDFTAFDLSSAVSATALSFESLAFENGIRFCTQISDGLCLTGSETAIRQLTTILLDNAFKYTDPGGCVTLSLLEKGDKKILSVHNTGKGIAQEDLKHIFERFYRSDNSRSRESGGYGLGLSIAASIARQHKGQLNAESDGESFVEFTFRVR